GFPVANEADGGITPASRIATFSASDKPVIFWTPDHGAFVVRGAMKAAWDKLKGATGKLGAPVADQTVDGDVVSQKFTGGKISWNRAKNTFTTDPANLAPLLSGLQVSGQNQPSNSASPPPGKKFSFQWWWLAAAVPVLLLIVMFVLVVAGLRRRRAGRDAPAYELDRGQDVAAAFDAGPDGHWQHDDVDYGSERFPPLEQHPEQLPSPDPGSGGRVSWSRVAEADGAVVGEPALGSEVDDHRGGAYPDDYSDDADEDADVHEDFEYDEFDEDEDQDRVDTAPTPIVTRAAFGEPLDLEPDVAETVSPEAFAPEVSVPQIDVPEPPVPQVDVPEPHPDGEFPDIFYPLDVATDDELPDAASPDADPGDEVRPGRHAAADPAGYAAVAAAAAYAAAPEAEAPPAVESPVARPTIHLPLADDPYRAPDGYPIKASARFGLFYTPNSALYDDTLAEIWFANEEVAQANGFVRAD
ncbi:MAG: hypothetical protein QOF15_1458, partial [Mycobacterium sp.]|nr:hypothetical protein [Mycobacterium sp.]